MIYFFQPWAYDGHLGKAYNQYMDMLPNNSDWAVLMDGDTMFLSNTWGKQIERVIRDNPHTSMFTCLTNRVGNPDQCFRKEMSQDPNIVLHRKIALDLAERVPYGTKVLNRMISGHMMVIQKSTWKRFRFAESYRFLRVDNDISRRLLLSGKEIRLMLGVYVFHYYRLVEGAQYKHHLTAK